jgi:beta-glucosidase
VLKTTGADALEVHAEDRRSPSPRDFIGINIFTLIYVRAIRLDRFRGRPHPPSFPHVVSWLFRGQRTVGTKVAKIWNVKEIYITENGCSSSDIPAQDGKVYDTDRVMYLRNYLTSCNATSEGVLVRLFPLGLMDNFECGPTANHFGLHYVDYATQKRTEAERRLLP